jgi:hypothetical protein
MASNLNYTTAMSMIHEQSMPRRMEKGVPEDHLQRRWLSLEEHLVGAHLILDRIAPRSEDDDSSPVSDGAIDTSNRCQKRLDHLIERISTIACAVGRL